MSYEAQHLIFKRLRPSLALALISLATLLLLPLETLWSILLMIVLSWSRTLLPSTSIGKILMVSQCKCVMGCKVVVGLEIVAYVATYKLSLLHRIGTFLSKSLISHAFLLSSFFYFHCAYLMASPFLSAHLTHQQI